ncbi:MAG TPA: 50S ribosomal protein L7/L12 [Phycisphaerae bacterium]|nr:50S ribosomal protein L7/L12 [Phycisphaerae bacterium]
MAEETEGRTWSKEIKTLGDKIVKLSVLQAKELGDYLEQEHGIKASAPAAVGMMPAAPAAEAAEEEKDSFDVVLTAVGDKKIPVVRALRDITNVGLREAKELVESAPRAVREGVSREEAEEIKAKLEEVGASVELK